MTTYITSQGDTWDGIAFKLYGAERHMTALIAANADQIMTVVFSAGVVLQAPQLNKDTSSSLPPWKRGTS